MEDEELKEEKKPVDLQLVFDLLRAQARHWEVENPTEVIAKAFGLHTRNAHVYLLQLRDRGVVKLTARHGVGATKYVKILRETLDVPVVVFRKNNGADSEPASDTANIPALKEETPKEEKLEIEKPETQKPANGNPKPAEIEITENQNGNGKGRLKRVIVLVDYDNAIARAEQEGFAVSFARLKEFCRKYGQIIFADAFLSPIATQVAIVAALWQAGFNVIACPMAKKDKDAVDAKINWRARQYLSITNAEMIVIVSDDADFEELADFASDMRKEVVFLDTAKLQEKIGGKDIVPELRFDSKVQVFADAIDAILEDKKGRDDVAKQYMQLVEALAGVLCGMAADAFYGFKALVAFCDKNLKDAQLRAIFNETQIRDALSALNHLNVLKRNIAKDGKGIFYSLNMDHPLITKLLFQSGN